jgi:hypothetical protein
MMDTKARSKLGALKKLGKNLRLYVDKPEMSSGLHIASHPSAARRRARLSKEEPDRDEA